MREILFRGKQLKDGKWTEGYYCPKPYSHFPCEPTIFPFDTINKDWHGERVDPESVGQYTGLTDKNGRRIFEGDIIEITDTFNKTICGVVYWCDGAFWADCSPPDCDECFYALGHLGDSVEAIGNEYDNPELLEGGADNG